MLQCGILTGPGHTELCFSVMAKPESRALMMLPTETGVSAGQKKLEDHKYNIDDIRVRRSQGQQVGIVSASVDSHNKCIVTS
jgi:hypothetical protein